MNTVVTEHASKPEHWKRGLFMILFAILYSVAEIVLITIAFIQFGYTLFTGEVNGKLKKLGNEVSYYVYQIFRFLTFNTEEKPFPLSDWPENPPEL